MSTVRQELLQTLRQIDRPGSFCARGSFPAILPGLEVAGLGAVGLPLNASGAKELMKHCEQAPFGKGEETLVDANVRRVWHLKPERFSLANSDWEEFLGRIVAKVQEDLGLEKQTLASHLYDLLLYEPGSFFLPHRDGEKLDRMVATLVVVLPSSFTGGELIVRHDGQEQAIDFSGDSSSFRIHYAAFYADCEHEIRPLREGYRLCLVYNLTLAKATKPIAAPRASDHVEAVSRILETWVKQEPTDNLVITLDHRYTKDGLVWDALKGVDRARANVLRDAARLAGCQVHLGLLTFHESGEGEDAGGDGYGRGRGRWDDDDEDEEDEDEEVSEEEQEGEYEMVEVFDTDLSADHWSDSEGQRLEFGEINVEEVELLDPDALRKVKPEEEFQGYTGNEGSPLDRWYRHGAIFLWPDSRHFEVLCTAGSSSATQALDRMVAGWQKSPAKDAAARKASCLAFAKTIIAQWLGQRSWHSNATDCTLLPSLARLDDAELIRGYLRNVVTKDLSINPGTPLVGICDQYGWSAFRPELESLFSNTSRESIERNVRLLELLSLATPRKRAEWQTLCEALADPCVLAIEKMDQTTGSTVYHHRSVKRDELLAGLARCLLATGQFDLLGRVVDHTLANPREYPLIAVHISALGSLRPWVEKNVKTSCPPLSRWLASCRAQLEALTAQMPEPPTDFRRDSQIQCKCKDCRELSQFLDHPERQEHRFTAAQHQRDHLENTIRHNRCDLNCKTEKTGRPYTLVCTKNTASYQAVLKKYHEDQDRLAALRATLAGLPG